MTVRATSIQNSFLNSWLGWGGLALSSVILVVLGFALPASLLALALLAGGMIVLFALLVMKPYWAFLVWTASLGVQIYPQWLDTSSFELLPLHFLAPLAAEVWGAIVRLSISDVLLVPVVLGIFISQIRSGRRIGFRRTSLDGWLIALAAVFLMGTVVVILRLGELSRYALINKDIGLGVMILGYYVTTYFVDSSDRLRALLRAFVLAGSVGNLIALVASFAYLAFGFENSLMIAGSNRLVGFLLNPTVYGGFATVIFLLQASLLLSRSKLLGLSVPLQWVNCFLLALGIGLTTSRSAWVAFAAGLFVLFLFSSKSRKVIIRSGILYTISMVLILWPLFPFNYCLPTNVFASGGPSSQPAFSPARAFDGNSESYWFGEPLADNWELNYALSSPRSIESITIEYHDATFIPQKAELYVSDGETSLKLGEFSSNPHSTVAVGGKWKNVRLAFSGKNAKTGNPASIREVTFTPNLSSLGNNCDISQTQTFNMVASNPRGFTDRIVIAQAALGLFLHSWDRILFGIGLGAFLQLSPSLMPYGVPLVVHNTYLWVLTEMGIIGFGVFSGFLLHMLGNVRRRFAYGVVDYSLLVGVLGGFAAMLVWLLLDEGLYQRHLWVLFALVEILAFSVIRREPTAADADGNGVLESAS